MEILVTAGAGLLLLGVTSQLTKKKKEKLQISNIETEQAEYVEVEEKAVPNIIKTPQDRLNELKPKTSSNGTTLKMEPFCRSVFEEYYGKPFDKKSSAFKNPRTNHYLELDGFNKDLKVAFEYQGEQHYNFPNAFHKTRKEFEDQVWRDYVKVEVCKRVGIKLVVIPYTIEYQTKKDQFGNLQLGRRRSKEEVKTILLNHLKSLES